MALSKPEIDAVVGEIAPVLSGGCIQKVFQPTPHAVILVVRARRKRHLLLISADPETARLHLLSARPSGPSGPPAFCQYLRARLQGARIQAVDADEHDRIVRMDVSTEEGPRSLLAALTGRSADLLLLDGAKRILKSLRFDLRKTGHLYEPPPAPSGAAEAPSLPAEWDERERFPVSRALEERYEAREAALTHRRARAARLAELRHAIKKTTRRVDALRSDLEKARRYQGFDRYGELIKASLDRLSKGQAHITVIDYYDPALPELTVPLDPAKSPRANMEDYFKKSRKYVTAERELRPRLLQAEQALQTLLDQRRAIERGEPPAVPSPSVRSTAAPPIRERRALMATKPESRRSGPFRRFTSSDGLAIYVGRNAHENEELTHRVARGDDLWLHARGAAGSHVVLRLEKGAQPPPDSVRDAATLALLYSDLKRSGRGEVVYTRKKWVNKARGQPPGTVTVTQEKSLVVSLDAVRLQALKERPR